MSKPLRILAQMINDFKTNLNFHLHYFASPGSLKSLKYCVWIQLQNRNSKQLVIKQKIALTSNLVRKLHRLSLDLVSTNNGEPPSSSKLSKYRGFLDRVDFLCT